MSIKTTARDVLSGFPRVDGLFRRFVWSRIHFPETEMQFLNSLPAGSIDIAVDVGAAHGSYAWILNRKSRDVYSFEPGRQHADYLERCTAGTRIHLVRAAVGNSCGTVNMYTPGQDSNALHSATLSTANPVAAAQQTEVRAVDQVTLDSVFLDKIDAGRSIDLLKVDVEGYESQVFEGACGLLNRHHPLVLCEIEARHNASYGRVFDLLRSLGYRTFIHKDGRFQPFDDSRIEPLQTESDLAFRLSPSYRPERNRYINNFVFQHEHSCLKVSR